MVILSVFWTHCNLFWFPFWCKRCFRERRENMACLIQFLVLHCEWWPLLGIMMELVYFYSFLSPSLTQIYYLTFLNVHLHVYNIIITVILLFIFKLCFLPSGNERWGNLDIYVTSSLLSPPFPPGICQLQFLRNFIHFSFCSIIMTFPLVLVLDLETDEFYSLSVCSPFAVVFPFQVHL